MKIQKLVSAVFIAIFSSTASAENLFSEMQDSKTFAPSCRVAFGNLEKSTPSYLDEMRVGYCYAISESSIFGAQIAYIRGVDINAEPHKFKCSQMVTEDSKSKGIHGFLDMMDQRETFNKFSLKTPFVAFMAQLDKITKTCGGKQIK